MTPRLRGSLLLDPIALVEKDHGRAVVDAAIRKLQPEHRWNAEAPLVHFTARWTGR